MATKGIHTSVIWIKTSNIIELLQA